MDPEFLKQQMLAENLGKSYLQFQNAIREELTKQLIDQAVADFKEKITPIIIETVTKISITAMNSYYEPVRHEPRVNIQFKL